MKDKNRKYKHLDFHILDLFCLIISFYFAINIKFQKNIYNESLYEMLFILCVCVELIMSYVLELFKNILKRGKFIEFKKTFEFDLISLLIIIVLGYVMHISKNISRIFIFLLYVIYFCISYFTRLIYKSILLRYSKKTLNSGNYSLLVITKKENLKKIICNISNNNYYFYKINGIYVVDRKIKSKTYMGFKIIGNNVDLISYVCHDWVDEVYLDIPYEDIPPNLVSKLTITGVNIKIKLSKFKELKGRKQYIDRLYNDTVLSSQTHNRTNLELLIKRLIDILGGIIGVIIMVVLMVMVGPIIYIKSPGPIFYKQKRVGKNGSTFYMYKFRSMIIGADKMKEKLQDKNIVKDGMVFKINNDPRIIPGIGTFIRKTSIDEFPQFINVLIGDMSLVGTRPPTLDEWQKYGLEHRIRMSIKPGITGIWQTNGRSKITDFNKIVEMDREYINNWSILLDIKILFKTLKCLLSNREDAM